MRKRRQPVPKETVKPIFLSQFNARNQLVNILGLTIAFILKSMRRDIWNLGTHFDMRALQSSETATIVRGDFQTLRVQESAFHYLIILISILER